MRLWHEELLPYLPRAQLLGQHRECCALRGLSWGKKHAVVDYVFARPPECLVLYHLRVMMEMARRGYRVEPRWMSPDYRGRRCEPREIDTALMAALAGRRPVYPEHTEEYRKECLANLLQKGIDLSGSMPTQKRSGRYADTDGKPGGDSGSV